MMEFSNGEAKIPLSTIIIILVQIVAMVAFATNLSADIDSTEAEVVRHDTRISQIENTMQTQQVTLARIDENLKHMMEKIDAMSK
jgi:Tfp pilus assembly protein PilO